MLHTIFIVACHRAEAVIRAVRDTVKPDAKVLIAPRMAVHRRDSHAQRKHLSHFVPAGDFQHLTRRKGRAASEGNGLRLTIKVVLMTDAGVKRPGLR